MLDIIKNYEFIMILSCVMIFMILQTYYFYNTISTEYDRILEEKMNSIKYFISKDEIEINNFKNMKQKYFNNNNNIVKIAEKQKQERYDINLNLYYKYCMAPILVIFVIIIILLFMLGKNNQPFNYFINFFLILLIFIPQIAFHYFVLKQYQYIGNTNIIYTIYNKNNINKK